MDEKRFDTHKQGKRVRDKNLMPTLFIKRALVASGLGGSKIPEVIFLSEN